MSPALALKQVGNAHEAMTRCGHYDRIPQDENESPLARAAIKKPAGGAPEMYTSCASPESSPATPRPCDAASDEPR
eukprot:CAMPEP_0170313254 /NCGR_PEP_ID=MMETSP0116_2-20130129/57174_1 /TAXON_ID=400756 /ORGANISM="Durinskia baltica, Strain CSIRO CS-38" /LENGTH=75 /DNA_ID=CAMNT_0010565651 /DNA_START=41 /DNA_END=266 /DNA_ORIENTATION=-